VQLAITDDEESDVEVGYDVAVHTKSTQARAQKPAKYSKPDEEVDEEEPAAVANGDAGDEEDEDEEDEDDEEVYGFPYAGTLLAFAVNMIAQICC